MHPPPYYAVIFSSLRTQAEEGYEKTSERMMELARKQPAFPGVESVRDGGFGITVSYWTDEESIRSWKEQVDHREAQRLGKEKWYHKYSIKVARVERAYTENG